MSAPGATTTASMPAFDMVEKAAFPGSCSLALGAMPVAAGIIGNVLMSTLLAARDMTAERGGAAARNRRHHLELTEAHVASVGRAPDRAVGAEDVRHSKTGRDIAVLLAQGRVKPNPNPQTSVQPLPHPRSKPPRQATARAVSYLVGSRT